MRPRPHADSDVFQRYSQLCAGNATTVFGTILGIDIVGGDHGLHVPICIHLQPLEEAVLKQLTYKWIDLGELNVQIGQITFVAKGNGSRASHKKEVPKVRTSSNVCETSSTCGKRKSHLENDSHRLQMQRPSAMRNVRSCGFTDSTNSDYEGVRQPNPFNSTRRKSSIERNVRPQTVADQYNGSSSLFAHHMGSTSSERDPTDYE
ncbi:hypothetical protein Tco_0687952 [Tanacetum coccineum]